MNNERFEIPRKAVERLHNHAKKALSIVEEELTTVKAESRKKKLLIKQTHWTQVHEMTSKMLRGEEV